MKIGIFARTFVRPTLDEVLSAVRQHDLSVVQFNFSCAGLASLPESLDPVVCRTIREAFARHGLEMAAVSGTFNAIHPDAIRRADDLHRCAALIRACPLLGCPIVTLCTGTRDAENMWHAHRDNQTTEAWRDLIGTLELLLPVAEESRVLLGIEPETANVVDSAARARQLLDEVRSGSLKIVMDAANLFRRQDEARMSEILTEAFDLLGPDIVLAHAKDITDDANKQSQAAGTGRLDWITYFQLLRRNAFSGALVLHNLDETQVAPAVRFLQRHAWTLSRS